MKHCIALVLLCLVQTATAADKTAPIYRCGNSYSNTPCAQGAAVPIDDSRTPAQKAQSEKVLAQDKAHAQALKKERLAQEKLAAQRTTAEPQAATQAAANKPAAPKTESPAPKHSKKKKKVEPAFFTATSETPAKAPKTKTRTKSSATSAQP